MTSKRLLELTIGTTDASERREGMKILHIIAPGPIAGAEKSSLASAVALNKAGHEVSFAVISERRNPELGRTFLAMLSERGLEGMDFLVRGRVDLGIVGRLHNTIVRGCYQVVHVHGYKALAYVMAFRRGLPPIISTYHGETAHTLAVRMYEWLVWALYHDISCLFAVSKGALVALERKGPLRCRVAIVPNMLSESFPEPTTHCLKGKDDPVELLYLGRLSFEKGADVLVQALAGISEGIHVRLTVLGDGPERGRLEKMAVELGLAERISFMGFKTNIRDYLFDAHVLVMPSRTEGLPMALIEAAACGRSVVASRVGGIPDIVEHGVNGLLVEPDHVKELAAAIEEMGANLDRFMKESGVRASLIRDTYSPEKWAEIAVAEYNKSLELNLKKDF